MELLLKNVGYEIVDFDKEADVYVINTCSVTSIADKKSRQMISRAKHKNPDAVIVAAGCFVQTASEEAKEKLPADILIGNNEKNKLPGLIEKFLDDRKKTILMQSLTDPVDYEDMVIKRSKGHTRSFIKIQDGCNQFCSYCIIPYARGRIRSRSVESVVEEVKALSEDGCKEIVLTGIHLSSYGKNEDFTLEDVIRELSEIDGIKRIRLGSLEPRVITEEFAQFLASNEKICPHFHLSLQSGCDETLKRMNRHYSAAEYKEKCDLLRRVFDNPALTTDVIVGFPGEKDEEFEKTYEYLKDLNLYEMHIFQYSKREGTRAAVMPDQVPESIKKDRSEKLIQMAKDHTASYIKNLLGMTLTILTEEEAEIDGAPYIIGFTKEYVKCAFKKNDDIALNETLSGVAKEIISENIILLN